MAIYKNIELSNEGGVYMKVSDLLMHSIAPFEIEDKKIRLQDDGKVYDIEIMM